MCPVTERIGRKQVRLFECSFAVLVGFGFWLIIDGVLSIVKYPKQTFPEQLIRVIRAAVGVIIVFIGIVGN